MPKLVGIGGYAGAGKDTAADYLVDQCGFEKQFMSDTLNEALRRLNPIVHAVPAWDIKTGVWGVQYYRYRDFIDNMDYAAAKKIDEIRDLQIGMGTTVGREMIHPDIWTHIAEYGNAFGRITEAMDAGRSVVYTGIRYHNELELIRELGGQTWWIERPGFGPVRVHSSELTLGPEDFMYVINNDSSLDALYNLAYERQLAVA